MASTETPPVNPEARVVVVDVGSTPPLVDVTEAEEAPPPAEVETAAEPQPEEAKTPTDSPPIDYFGLAEVVLRFLLFASAVAAVVLIVTSEQTKHSKPAKFQYSPALIYFVAAVSVLGLYSLITTLFSFYALLKPGIFPQVVSHFVIVDVVVLGVVGAATGSAGAIAYTGLKGNSHLGWGKVCGVYDKFCLFVGASAAVSLFASVLLTLLVLLSVYSLSKKIPK